MYLKLAATLTVGYISYIFILRKEVKHEHILFTPVETPE